MSERSRKPIQAVVQNPTPKPGVMNAPFYVAGEHKIEGVADPIILSANENPLGPSPKAQEAFRSAGERLHRYPDGGSTALRAAIAKQYGLDADRIMVGNGSDELISLITRTYAGVGDEVLYSKHGFVMYKITALGVGATPVAAEEKELCTDVDAVLATASHATKLVFIANPNNPTGSYLPESEVRRLIEGLPSHVLCVLDAAYAEYVSRNDYEAGAQLVEDYDNVVMLRTFSKIHGLAALRLGWAYANPSVIDAVSRIKGPFNVSAPALAAGVAAVEDAAYVEESRRHNDQWLPWISEKLKALGIDVPSSVGNFIIAGFKDKDQAKRATAFLESKGIIARDIGSYHLPQFVRLTIGKPHECEALAEAMSDFMGSETA